MACSCDRPRVFGGTFCNGCGEHLRIEPETWRLALAMAEYLTRGTRVKPERVPEQKPRRPRA